MNVQPFKGEFVRRTSGETEALAGALELSLSTGEPMEISGLTGEQIRKFAARLRNMGVQRDLSVSLRLNSTGLVVLATPRPVDYKPRTRTAKPKVEAAPAPAPKDSAPVAEFSAPETETPVKAPVKRTRRTATPKK